MTESRPHARVRELTVPMWYTLGAMVCSMVVLAVLGVIYVGHVDAQQKRLIREQAATERENDQRWCRLLSTLDEQYRGAPPATETGRRVAGAIADLRQQFDCPP